MPESYTVMHANYFLINLGGKEVSYTRGGKECPNQWDVDESPEMTA